MDLLFFLLVQMFSISLISIAALHCPNIDYNKHTKQQKAGFGQQQKVQYNNGNGQNRLSLRPLEKSHLPGYQLFSVSLDLGSLNFLFFWLFSQTPPHFPARMHFADANCFIYTCNR